MMTLKLYECGLTDAIVKIEKLLDLALNVTNKWQASILVAEALGVARAVNALVIEVDDTEECE